MDWLARNHRATSKRRCERPVGDQIMETEKDVLDTSDLRSLVVIRCIFDVLKAKDTELAAQKATQLGSWRLLQ